VNEEDPERDRATQEEEEEEEERRRGMRGGFLTGRKEVSEREREREREREGGRERDQDEGRVLWALMPAVSIDNGITLTSPHSLFRF
jgi:hypothetical protein